MKKLFIISCVIIKMKPCALFPLFLSICGKPHATAAPGKPITSGSELVGLHQVWGSLPLPHCPTAPSQPCLCPQGGSALPGLPLRLCRGHGLPCGWLAKGSPSHLLQDQHQPRELGRAGTWSLMQPYWGSQCGPDPEYITLACT